TIYRQVEILNAHGFKAFVGLPKKPVTDFYGTTAQLLIHGGRIQVQQGGIFFIPQGFPPEGRGFIGTPARTLLFFQNQYYLPFTCDPSAGIAEFGVHEVIASSEAVRDFFRDVYGVADVPLLPYAVDPQRFRPAAQKKRQIAFMPRKLRADARFIEAT